MIPEQIRELALQLHTVVFEGEGVAELAIWQRCLHTCQYWDVEPPTAILISEALTGYLADVDDTIHVRRQRRAANPRGGRA